MLNILRAEFGNLAGAQSGYDCLQNAVHNTALAMHIGERSQILYVCKVKEPHAYLSDGQNAYSHGLTWMTTYYPELSLRQIAELNGKDVTNIIFWQALQITEDKLGYHRVLERLADLVPGLDISVASYYGGK